MRIRTQWLVPVLIGALVYVGASEAQSPDKKGGKGKKGGRGPDAAQRAPNDGFRGPGGGAFAIQRVLDDLNLADKKKEQAEAIVKANQENVRKLMDLAHSDLLLKMKDILNDEEFKSFKVALDRSPGPGRAFGPAPGGPPAPGGRGDGRRGLNSDEIVERLMSFDKNKDGKVTKDELPERMQDLIAKGDTNKDGALDKDEIKKLAADLARDQSFRGFDAPRGPGGFRPGDGRGGAPGGFRPGDGFRPGGGAERALDELKLSEKKRDQAEATLRADRENIRKLMDLAHSDLLLKMNEVLSADEFKKFKAATDRQLPAGPGGPPRTGDVERRLEQLQRELEELRRELRR